GTVSSEVTVLFAGGVALEEAGGATLVLLAGMIISDVLALFAGMETSGTLTAGVPAGAVGRMTTLCAAAGCGAALSVSA
ncbi:MAG: hypothetical protein RSF70_05580, partial [Ruthenibacterium sp.]